MTYPEMLDARMAEARARNLSFQARRLLWQAIVIAWFTGLSFLFALSCASLIETTARNAAMADGVQVGAW